MAPPPPGRRDAGASAWLAVGVTVFVIGVVWLLSLTHTIVTPVIAAAVVAAVAGPLVAALERHGVKRGLGAALVLLGMVAVTAVVVFVVLAGITSQLDALGGTLS